MKTYEKYKSSGIEWIGDIPEHWEFKRLKFATKVNSPIPSFNYKKSSTDEVVFLPMEKVSENGEINQDSRKPINEVSSGFTYFEKGDVILAKITPCFENGKGALLENLQTDFGYGSTEFHTLRKTEKASSKFLFFVIKSNFFRTVGEAFMSGAAGQKRVSTDFVRDFQIAFPPIAEQSAIADYLDEKTAEIDKLIANKERLIELLKEERTAIINKAVTRGINADAKLKPSGIDWLGDIPEHWEVKKLKWFAKTTSGSTPNTGNQEEYYDGDIPWVRTLDLNNSEVLNTEHKITQKAVKDTACKILPINTVCVAMYGGAGTIGKNGILKIVATTNQAVCAIIPNENFNSEFLLRFIQFFRPYWMIGAEGTRRDPNISQDDIKNVLVPFPPIEEQREIVEFIESKTNEIDSTISKIEKEIELIKEYRTALISEVVTGKIKVI